MRWLIIMILNATLNNRWIININQRHRIKIMSSHLSNIDPCKAIHFVFWILRLSLDLGIWLISWIIFHVHCLSFKFSVSFAMFVFVLCLVFIIVRVSGFSIIDFPFGFLYLLYKTIALLTKLWRHKINLHLTSTNDSIHDEEGTSLSRVMFTVVIFRCCRCSSECHLGFILPVLWKNIYKVKIQKLWTFLKSNIENIRYQSNT
jgi:hypothetical protein